MRDGGDGAGAARDGAGRQEGKARCGPGRYGIHGGRQRTAATDELLDAADIGTRGGTFLSRCSPAEPAPARIAGTLATTRRRRRRCRPPPPRNRRSAAARRRHAPPDAPSLVVTPASFRLPTCRDDLGPCISGPDGVVLLAWRWLDSRDGGPTYLDPGVLACSPSPVRPSVSAGRRDARLAPPCRLARAGWPLGLFFARRDSRTVALAERPPRLFPTCLVMRDK